MLLVLVLAASSTARTFSGTWSRLSREHQTYAALTKREPNVVPGYEAVLPGSALRFFAARARRGDRFFVQARPGTFIAGVDYPTAVRTLARYELLPAVEVEDPRRADLVLSVGTDPASLGLRYERIERGPDGAFAARVRR